MPVKLLYCYDCKIYTNHHKTQYGNLWVCWCGHVEDLENEEEQEAISDAEWLQNAESEK